MAKTSRTKATRAKTTRAKAPRKTAAKSAAKGATKSRGAAKSRSVAKRAPARSTRATARKAPARKAPARKPAARKAAVRKAPAARKAPARRASRGAAPADLNGWITHTDITSNNAEATKEWCAKVLGWKFVGSMPTPTGEYHMFAYSDKGGGGVHGASASEAPSNTPYVYVRDARATFESALAAGAETIQAPEDMGDLVTTAIVRAPGGVVIGLSSPLKGRS